MGPGVVYVFGAIFRSYTSHPGSAIHPILNFAHKLARAVTMNAIVAIQTTRSITSFAF